MTVLVKGVVADDEFTTSWRPVGADARLSTTVRGLRVTLVVADAPSGSVAVRRSTSAEGYSWSGAVNCPLATPTKVCTGCWWQVLGQ